MLSLESALGSANETIKLLNEELTSDVMMATDLFVLCEEGTSTTAFLEQLAGQALISEFFVSTEGLGSGMVPDFIPWILEHVA